MRHLLIAGALVLTAAAHANAQAQQLDLANSNPLNLTFLEQAKVGEVFDVIARLGGVTLEFDASVTREMQQAPLSNSIRINGGTVEEVISVLTSTNGLTYTIIGPRTVRISKKV